MNSCLQWIFFHFSLIVLKTLIMLHSASLSVYMCCQPPIFTIYVLCEDWGDNMSLTLSDSPKPVHSSNACKWVNMAYSKKHFEYLTSLEKCYEMINS